MNKSELLENYTKEQLSEMVIKAYEKENAVEKITISVLGFPKIYAIKEIEEIVGAYEEIKFCEEQNKKCKTLLPAEYLKVLSLNHTIEKQQGEINSIKEELHRKETTINQIDDILKELFGVTHDISKPDEFREILKEKIENSKTIADFLPIEPIKVANMLINAEGEHPENSIARVFEKTYRLFDISELRQISEHLLIYCNANGEGK